MKPAPFRYAAPRSIEELLALKAEHGDDAKFLAGGQSLIPTMNFRLAQPAVLLDLNTLPDQNFIVKTSSGGVRIGALVRHSDIETSETIARSHPLAHEAIRFVAHPQIRNRGTLCGNLAHADPASEMPAVMLALGGRFHARSAASDRWIDASDFFLSIFTTALEENEMLCEVEMPPLPPGSGTCFLEVSRRPGDFAMMGVATVVSLDEAGRCAEARIAYCSAGETPLLAPGVAASLAGEEPDETALLNAARQAAEEIDPPGNVHLTSAYQKHLVAVLTGRALRTAFARANTSASQ
ncbi:MAG: xanthine dehydrogenase family protein subunit M [Alphaproteobacteria bacterium]|nr:xanthine dehydrogenase family protein subunit M [Alphaproteobacteria bacterium]